jgi:UDP-N-acetylmuramyl pentapeptide phosphotransferase/UDP-N-acetylglucosamine-1-phosphate transferase
MGDTGSLILGFAITVLVFRFNELNSILSVRSHLVAAPAFSFAVLIIPMFDTLRVFTIRILRGGSPFKADNRHIHHMLLALGLTHLKATLILVLVNVLYIAFAYYFNYLGNSVLVYYMIGSACVLSFLTMMLLRRKNRKKIAASQQAE